MFRLLRLRATLASRLLSIGVLALLVIPLTACNLVSQEEVLVTDTPPGNVISGKPSVTITSPRDGEQFQVDREILVTASATDESGVTRVQLLANNQPVRTVLSETEQGDKQKNVALGYTPRASGEVTLSVVAYRGTVASDPAQIRVNVVSQVVATATGGGSSSTPGGGGVPTIDTNDPTCRARAKAGLNMRQGPGVNFPVLLILNAGNTVPIIGRLGDNSWWQVRSGSTIGWVFADITDVFGSCGAVPIVLPPITITATFQPPTVPPTFTPSPTVIVPTVTHTPTPPDLRIEAFDGDRELTLSGSGTVTGTYRLNVRNTGGERSGPFDITYTLINLTTVQTEEPEFLPEISNLRRDEVIALEFDIEFTAAGVYRIEIEADASGDVGESNENNNDDDLTVTVQAAP